MELPKKEIRVLIVDDSPVFRKSLTHMLSSDPQIRVIGTATNGEEAIEAVKNLRPDLVTMDVLMPKMNGHEATRRIMETTPLPIVMISGIGDKEEISLSFKAIETGALAMIPKPKGHGHSDHSASVEEMILTIKLMSEVKVVKLWPRKKHFLPSLSPATDTKISIVSEFHDSEAIQLVAIGASTGGPNALLKLLSELPKDFPVPLIIVQHMAPGFLEGFVEWLGEASGFPVSIPLADERLLPGHAYVAPENRHIGIKTASRVFLSVETLEHSMRPAVSFLFRSVAEILGRHAAGVLLTGMGADGAEELKLLRDKGAITFAQDEESSIVHGMPGEAIRLQGATYVLNPEKIAKSLIKLVKSTREDLVV